MIAPSHSTTQTVLALIRTLYEILLLKKGPEDLPNSVLLLVVTTALWFSGLFVASALIQDFTMTNAGIATLSWSISLFCYGLVVNINGYGERLTRGMTAVIGCGALISILQIFDLVLLPPFLGQRVAEIGAMLLLFWSVLVEGHIIARVIERHWYLGIAVASAVFIVQFLFLSAMTPAS